ncbi:MAG TPA: DUF5819 family protein [Actinocrinis sp.]|nr:DUF5819 family protein [Actinocrinis sp.]
MTGDRVPEFPQPPGTAEQAGQGEADDPPDSAARAAEAVSTSGAAPTAWWSRALVALVAVLTAGLVGLHLGATFLYNAPSNPVSQKYAGPLRDWMTPVFTQNWQLFAPNPLSEEIDVQARGSVAGSGQVTAWRDLSVADVQATVHNPVPSQVTLNALRNAVLEWLATHDAQGDPTAPNAATAQQYLSNMAVQRLTAQVGGTYSSIQVRLVFTLLPGPGRTAAQTAPQSRTLDWWVLPA